MSRHEPDEEGRCRVSTLPADMCSGCRGSDTTFVDALLATEKDPGAEDPALTVDEVDDTLPVHMRSVQRDTFWLNSGPPTEPLERVGHSFKSRYYGSRCQVCPDVIKENQVIVRTNRGGYAHAGCLA